VSILGWPLLLFLIAVSAVGPMALNGVLPGSTAIMLDLNTRYELVQLVLTVYLFANLLSQLLMGPAADRYGRRPVMLFGLIIFGLGSVACALATSIEALLAARFFQGFGGAVCLFLPRTVVRDLFDQNKAASVIGYITTAMMVAPLFAPAMGGFCACAIMQAGAVGVYYSFLAGAPFVAMQSRGMSASAYGIWFAIVACGYLSGNLVAGRFSQTLGVHKMIALGAVPFCFGVVLFWTGFISAHPSTLFVPMLIVAFSNGMALPSMFSIAMGVRPEFAASASGLAGSLQMAMGVLLTLLVGYLLPMGDSWLFLIMSVSMILCMVGLAMTLRSRESAAA